MENLIDKTVLSTPKPCASSTVDRKDILKKIDRKYGARPTIDFGSICDQSDRNNSLGIIYDIDQKEDLPMLNNDNENISIYLQRQRQLAQNTLERSKIGLPAKFLVASNTPCSTISRRCNNSSTVTESDLLRSPATGLRASITSDSFAPDDVSTPKGSDVIEQSLDQPFKSLSEIIGETTKKIRNSDISLKDLCTELSRLSTGKLSLQSGSNIDSGMFVPAELMEEKLLKDEMSWREKNDLPTKLKTTEKESISSERDVDEFILANKSDNVGIPRVVTTLPTPQAAKEKSQNASNTVYKSPNAMAPVWVKTNDRYLDVNTPETLYTPNSPSENKENTSDSNRSLTSVRSGSSLDTLPDGKFPIKSNRLELVWGCLRFGRSSTQDFQIRNQLNQRIRMQASITGSCFRLTKENYDSEMLTVTTFVLRPLETKSFSIMFCPTNIGAASERINFYPILGGEIQHSKRQVLTLFGYGGHTSCDIGNITKDSGGRLWLSLGRIECQTFIEQTFTIKNTGTLSAFACIDIVLKGPFTYSDLKVDPKEVIIRPQEEISATIRYYPSKQDLRHLKNADVFEVGYIKIITGAEVIRGRLRRLCMKLKQKDTPIDPLIERLSNVFAGEKMPADLRYLKESVSAVKDLLLQLSFREIVVTIEQDLESTLVNPILDMGETTMYHTLYQDNDDITEITDMTPIKSPKLFVIEPTNIILTFPGKREDTILLHSKNSKNMAFDVKVEPHRFFSVYPTNGTVAPYETIIVKILYHPQSSEGINCTGRVLIYVENEAIEITVKTIFIKTK
ncbi:hypothetical protein Trydic_g2036 [Trypoxylus dichotomus]